MPERHFKFIMLSGTMAAEGFRFTLLGGTIVLILHRSSQAAAAKLSLGFSAASYHNFQVSATREARRQSPPFI